MPTSSVARAIATGRTPNAKVLGRVPPDAKKAAAAAAEKAASENKRPGTAPSFPPKPKEPTKQHSKGRGLRPTSSGAEVADEAKADATASSAIEPNSWGASDPAIHAALERELGAIRKQLAMRQEIADGRRKLAQQTASSAPYDSLRPSTASSTSLSEHSMRSFAEDKAAPPPPPYDKAAERMRKRVDAFEAIVVRKLIARTPPGPTGVGALKVLTKAFEYYDTEGDGVVAVEEFTRVLAKLNVVSALPPSAAEREVISALFAKYAKQNPTPSGELAYGPFARALLRASGNLVPAAEVLAQQDAERFQYTTAVRQALARRSLEPTDPAKLPGAAPGWRAAWDERSAAARHIEERHMYDQRIPPISEALADGAAKLRGRLMGGAAGFKEYTRLMSEQREADLAARRQQTDESAAAIAAIHAEGERRRQSALDGWRQIERQNRELGGMTPGEASARARRGPRY